LVVAEAERVRELVDEGADLAVGRSGGDDDLPALGVTPATRPVVGQLTDLDAVAELATERLQRCEQVAVAVALDRLRGWRDRDGLEAGQRSVIATSKTGTVRKKMRFSPVSAPASSRCLTATGARILTAFSPWRTQRLRARKARKPAM
jgi:hypothetical protein